MLKTMNNKTLNTYIFNLEYFLCLNLLIYAH